MKKWMLFLAVWALFLMGCQAGQPASTGAATTVPTQGGVGLRYFAYQAGEVELIPGKPFDKGLLPEPVAVNQIPSCAFEGTDNVYTYEAFEVIAYEQEGTEYLYSVYILDANVKTPEGLALGDAQTRVDEIYGSDYTANGTERRYQKSGTELSVILLNGRVQSIEIRMAQE